MHPSLPELLALVDDFERDEANALVDAMTSGLDPESTIATCREIAAAMREKYEDEYAVRAMWIAFAVATGAPEIAIAVACELAHDLDEALDDDGFARLHAELAQRYASDPATELRVRMAIAAVFDAWTERAFIADNLRAAHALATTELERLDVATKLLAFARATTLPDPDTLESCIALANQLAADAGARDAVIRADLEIMRGDPVLAHRHASRAYELGRASTDRALLSSATHAFAELLLDADLLERADEVASSIDGEADVTALVEDIRRRRGLADEPPPEVFVAPPETDVAFTRALPEGFAEYFTRDATPATAIARVVSPEKIREWSYGAVRTIADLESQKIFGPIRSYACACARFLGVKYRGVVCHRCGIEVIDRRARQDRVGHIVLPEPVVHPWHASTIAALLGIGVREAQHGNAAELRDRLRDMGYDVHRIVGDLRDRRPTDPRLAIMDAVTDSVIRPEWLVLEMIPVWPPETPLLRDRDAVTRAYIEVLDGVDVRSAVSHVFSQVAKQLASG